MQHLLIVYDIPNNKTRKRVGDILEGFGTRVNRSVFECIIKNNTQREKLEEMLKKELNQKEDSLRIYPLCANCIKNAKSLTNEPEPFDADGIYFF